MNTVPSIDAFSVPCLMRDMCARSKFASSALPSDKGKPQHAGVSHGFLVLGTKGIVGDEGAHGSAGGGDANGDANAVPYKTNWNIHLAAGHGILGRDRVSAR